MENNMEINISDYLSQEQMEEIVRAAKNEQRGGNGLFFRFVERI